MNKTQAKQLASGKKPNANYSTSIIADAIEEAANLFVEDVKMNMQKYGMDYKEPITININNEGVQIVIPDYIEYADKGVNGIKQKYGSPYSRSNKKPPLSAVKEWMQENGIPIKDGLEYVMQQAWHDKGVKPKYIYSKDALEKLIKNIQSLVKQYLEQSQII